MRYVHVRESARVSVCLRTLDGVSDRLTRRPERHSDHRPRTDDGAGHTSWCILAGEELKLGVLHNRHPGIDRIWIEYGKLSQKHMGNRTLVILCGWFISYPRIVCDLITGAGLEPPAPVCMDHASTS